MIPVNSDRLFTVEYVRTLVSSEAESLKATQGYEVCVTSIEDGRRFCVTVKRNERIADLWFEVESNLGDNDGKIKRELSLITTIKLAPIKTPVSDESELIQELLRPAIEATET